MNSENAAVHLRVDQKLKSCDWGVVGYRPEWYKLERNAKSAHSCTTTGIKRATRWQ